MSTAESSPATVQGMFVGGAWRRSASGETFDATSPGTGEVIGVDSAGRSLRRPGPRSPPRRRAATGGRPYTAFARAARCTGRRRRRAPPRGARAGAHARPGQTAARGAYDEVDELMASSRSRRGRRRLEGSLRRARPAGQTRAAVRRPRGVGRGGHPVELALHDARGAVAPALAGGNTVVWTPAPTRPCARRARRLRRGGRPAAGCPQPRHRPRRGRRRRARRHPGDRRRRLHRLEGDGPSDRRASGRQAPLLEMGGNGPLVVLDGADIDGAVEGALSGVLPVRRAELYGGRAPTRRRGGARRLRRRLAQRGGAGLRLGDPRAPETTMGPLNNEGSPPRWTTTSAMPCPGAPAWSPAVRGRPTSHRPLLDGDRPRRRRRGRRGRARGDLRTDRPHRPHPRARARDRLANASRYGLLAASSPGM